MGRPTLIELALGSQMQAAGELVEGMPAKPETVAFDLSALPVYPIGAVTLTLPVLLPQTGGVVVDDQVLISYMACNSNGCHNPVVEKLVDVQVPGK